MTVTGSYEKEGEGNKTGTLKSAADVLILRCLLDASSTLWKACSWLVAQREHVYLLDMLTGKQRVHVMSRSSVLSCCAAPVAGPDTPPSDVLLCPDIREHLEPQDSPFLRHKNWDSGFVDDEDRVAINTLEWVAQGQYDRLACCIGCSTQLAGQRDRTACLHWRAQAQINPHS
eukprot:scaffold8791_cov18-Tisochrysis_lutea.AAC.1